MRIPHFVTLAQRNIRRRPLTSLQYVSLLSRAILKRIAVFVTPARRCSTAALRYIPPRSRAISQFLSNGAEQIQAMIDDRAPLHVVCQDHLEVVRSPCGRCARRAEALSIKDDDPRWLERMRALSEQAKLDTRPSCTECGDPEWLK